MHYVTDVSHVGEYKLNIRFEDGADLIVDLSEHLDGPIFEPLKNPAFFKRFTLNRDIETVVWPNGADFSPDFLYEIGERTGKEPAAVDSPKRVVAQ